MFGADLPMFNLKGKAQVNSKTGIAVSFVLLSVILVYACLKFVHLVTMHNPQTSEVLEQNIFDSETKLDLNQIKFKIAFSVEGYDDQEMKDDPRYVKFIVRLVGKKNNVPYQKMLAYRKCTDQDWA